MDWIEIEGHLINLEKVGHISLDKGNGIINIYHYGGGRYCEIVSFDQDKSSNIYAEIKEKLRKYGI